MKDFFAHSSYVFVLAHPDDEVYTVNIIHRLVHEGKEVNLIYVTSGDYAKADIAREREQEVASVVKLLGLAKSHVHFLRFAERELLDKAPYALTAIRNKLQSIAPDCVISHDYEGGHNHHDFVSFCAHSVAREMSADLWVFPAYHGLPDERRWNEFVSGRTADLVLELGEKEAELKQRAFAAHATQKQFFDTILSSSSREQVLASEVLRHVSEPIDFAAKPTDPMGYEFPGSPVKYSDFADVLNQE